MAYYFNTDKQDVPFIVEGGDDSPYVVLNNEGLIRSSNSNYYPVRPISLYNLTPEPVPEYKRAEPTKQESSRNFFDIDYYDLDFEGEPIDTPSISAAEYETPPEPVSAEEAENILALGDELEALLTREKVHFKFSSKKRKPGLAGKAGSRSWHVRGYAWDIVPDGVNWAQLKKEIYGNPRIIAWLRKKRNIEGMQRSIGILDETREDVMKKTGATGKHLHFGVDREAIKMLEDYIANPHLWKYEKGGKIKINNYTDSIINPFLFQQKPMIKVNRTGGILRMALGQQFPLNDQLDMNINYTYNDSTINGADLGVDHMSETGIPIFPLNTPGPKKKWFEQYKPNPIKSTKYLSDYVTSIPKEFIDKFNLVLPTANQFSELAILNSIKAIDYLVVEGGFTPLLAAALVGVFLDENSCGLKSVNKHEYDQKGTAFTRGDNQYGAGMASWTGATKMHYLKMNRMPLDTKVENLSILDQCKMIATVANTKEIKEDNGKIYRNYLYDPFQRLKQAKTFELASPAAFIITAGHNHWKDWNNSFPTQQRALEVANRYGRANSKGKKMSAYQSNTYGRREAYGRLLLSLVQYYYNKIYNK